MSLRLVCAHLATRAWEDAYLALLTAHGLLVAEGDPRTASRGGAA